MRKRKADERTVCVCERERGQKNIVLSNHKYKQKDAEKEGKENKTRRRTRRGEEKWESEEEA